MATKDKISVAVHWAKGSFAKFKKYHAESMKDDDLTAKERFEKIGGKVPGKSDDNK